MAAETSLGQLATAGMATGRRALVADASRRLARLAFGVTVVLSPVRASVVLASRPEALVYSGYTDFVLPASEIALLTTLLLWTLSLVANPRPISLGPGFLRWPLLGLLALVWLGVPFSIDPALSAFNAAQLLIVAAFAVYALNEIESLASLAWPLGLMVGLQSIVGLGQLVAQRSLGLQSLGELVLDPARNGMSVVAASGTPRLLRAYGLTDHPNILAGLLAFGLLILLLGSGAVRGRRSVAIGLVVALGLGGLFATFSRAGWVATAAGLMVGLAMLAGRVRRPAMGRRSLLVAAAGAVLVAGLLIPYSGYLGVRLGLASGVSVTEEMSIGERTILVDAASSIALRHPLTGTGLNTLALAMVGAEPGLTFDYQPAHVVVLDVAAEAGIPAALCYVAVLVLPWLALWRIRGHWTPELAAASAALAAVTVVGLFDYYTWTFMPGRIWAWLVLALWAGAFARSRIEQPDAV